MVGGGGARCKARGGTARCSLTFMYCTPSGRKMVFSFHVFSGQGMGCRQRYEERMLAPLARGGSPLHRPKLMDGVCSPPSVAVEAAPSYFASTLVTLACAPMGWKYSSTSMIATHLVRPRRRHRQSWNALSWSMNTDFLPFGGRRCPQYQGTMVSLPSRAYRCSSGAARVMGPFT